MRDNGSKHGYAKRVGNAQSFTDYVYDPACVQQKRGYKASALLVVLAALDAKDAANGVSARFSNAGYECPTCKFYHTTSSPLRGKRYVKLVDGKPSVFNA